MDSGSAVVDTCTMRQSAGTVRRAMDGSDKQGGSGGGCGNSVHMHYDQIVRRARHI